MQLQFPNWAAYEEGWHSVKYLIKKESTSLDTHTEFTEAKLDAVEHCAPSYALIYKMRRIVVFYETRSARSP